MSAGIHLQKCVDPLHMVIGTYASQIDVVFKPCLRLVIMALPATHTHIHVEPSPLGGSHSCTRPWRPKDREERDILVCKPI